MIFALTLERTVLDTIESGKMTKDLAIAKLGSAAISNKGVISISRESYLSTEEFIDEIADNLAQVIKITDGTTGTPEDDRKK